MESRVDLLDAMERLLREENFGNVARTVATGAATLSAEAPGSRVVIHIEESTQLPAGAGTNAGAPNPETVRVKAAIPNFSEVLRTGTPAGSGGSS